MVAHWTHRYAVLFYTLLVTLAMAPLLAALHFSSDLLQVFLAFSLLVAVLDVPHRRGRPMLLLLIAVAVAMRVVPTSEIRPGLASGALLLALAVGLVAAGDAVWFAMRSRVISSEQVYAALSAYLLAGVSFGVLHWTIETAWPGSFVESGAEGGGFQLSTAIYYSFVTLATLGYGDVVPRGGVARGVAVLEAVGGQLYVAVTVARLVGSHLQSATQEAPAAREIDGEPDTRRPAP
jgi:ion channel